MSFSKAIVAGNLTRDPEQRTLPSGASVVSLSIALNSRYKTREGDEREEVSYIDLKAFGALGVSLAKHARKGSGLLVEGRLKQERWEDKASGQQRSKVVVVVESFNFYGGRPGGVDAAGEPQEPSTLEVGDDVPF